MSKWDEVDRSNPEACWNWTGAVDKDGYGRAAFGIRAKLAHRLAYEKEHGPIPKGVVVCHRCDNRRCINPSHLWPGTHADNVRDRVAKGRSATGDRNGMRLKRTGRKAATSNSNL